MNPVECARCGQSMPGPGDCPVCETPWTSPAEALSGSVHPRPDDTQGGTLAARLWRSGQLPVALAAVSLVLAMPVPLLRDVRFVGGTVSVSLLDVVMDRHPLVGRFAGWLVLGAGLFLVSMLYSRRTGSAMAASRPMLAVVSLAPVVGAALPFLRMRRYGQDPGVGPAVVLVAIGVVLGVLGALRFGTGVPDPRRPRLDDPDDD